MGFLSIRALLQASSRAKHSFLQEKWPEQQLCSLLFRDEFAIAGVTWSHHIILSPLSNSSLEEGVTIHSSILAWRISWTEEPGGLQSMASQTVRHNWSEGMPVRKEQVLKRFLQRWCEFSQKCSPMQSMGLQKVGHSWVTKQQILKKTIRIWLCSLRATALHKAVIDSVKNPILYSQQNKFHTLQRGKPSSS